VRVLKIYENSLTYLRFQKIPDAPNIFRKLLEILKIAEILEIY
jgi:hypothetical protein